MPLVTNNAPTPPTHPGMLMMISGPSGVGKSTLIQKLHGKFDFVFSVSATTRARTEHEVDGVDYQFIDEATFQKWIAEDRFLEHALVFDRYYYGTPKEPVEAQLAQGRIVVLDIDVQGARQVRSHCPDAFGVFILPPSEDILHHRLVSRGRDAPEVIEKRFAHARSEIALAKSESLYDALIVNDVLDRAAEELDALLTNRLNEVARGDH